MSADVAVRARGLGKAYPLYNRPSERLKQFFSWGRWQPPSFWALRDIDLDLYRGETVGIVGRNGSGKSTLLELITGTLTPSAGRVEVYGRLAALLELGAGFNPDFSGRENVRLKATILGMPQAEIDRRFDEILAFADIGEFVDRPVKTYSSGMYARLAFAVAIHVVPDVLVIDELLAVGDEAFQRKCFARIEAIKARGGTILLVSHSASAILELCDRAVLLDRGEHLLTGSPRAVVTAYQRLLYAPPGEDQRIRAEIAAAARDPEVLVGPPAAGEAAEAESAATAPAPPPELADPAFLDPHLVSRSAVHYPVQGAEIRDPVLLTRDGRPVNCLTAGERYVLRYRVHVEKDAFDVRFHTLVKTVSGLELGGGTHPEVGVLGPDLRAGSVVEVEFEFRCGLNPGVYFLNCGVTGCGDVQLHRIVDALAFRVLPIAGATTFGHVNFAHRARVRPAS